MSIAKFGSSVIAVSIGALALTVAGPARAGGLILYEVGTADVALASAGYSARAQDASTVLSNPAGMTLLDGKQVLLGTQMLYTDPSFSVDSGTSPELGSTSGGNPIGFFPGGSGFYTQEISPKLTVGFGLAGNFGVGLEYNDDWVGRYYVKKAALLGVSLLPSIAYQVTDKLSLGVSLNAMYGMTETKVAVNNIVAGPDGGLKLKDEEWGFGGNVGVLYQISPATRLGLTYTSQVDLDFSSNAEFSGLAPGLEAVLDSRGLLNAEIDLGIKVPQTVMASVFSQIDPTWALLASVGWQDWSEFGRVDVSIESNNPVSLTTDAPYQDTWHGALGGQYRLSDAWLMNFGVAYDSAFQEGSTVSPAPPPAGWRFGVGAQQLVTKSFHWGAGAEYQWGGTLDVNNESSVPVANGGRGNLVGKFRDVQTLFVSANFGWNF